jgi:hypothetical protein
LILLAVQSKHIGANMVLEILPNDICLQKIGILDRSAVTESKWPILNGVSKRPPDTVAVVSDGSIGTAILG